ncbi:phosphopantetheine-binding protein [Aromatoleum anaerobium]|nr:phosphopantetheine-binding protein [Aromatoleum anaerobium]MCK0509192.1 phosphopantetheine-binding protein [Aromatoleum anaerobium]
MNIQEEVLSLLDEVLNLNGRGLQFDAETPLLGSVPELDSMAVLAVIHTIEERFAIEVPDDEIDGSSFATVGTVVEFVTRLSARLEDQNGKNTGTSSSTTAE